jgi:hypothetical protein
MQLPHVQDRIVRGYGAAARKIGDSYDAYRPISVNDPIAPANRFLRLPAAFSPDDLSFHRPASYGHATWFGLFDSAYTQPGDYLKGPGGTFFIVAQQPLLPILCVLASRTLSVSRPAAPAAAGVNSYGGVTLATSTPLISGWPASVLSAGTGRPGVLPSDGRLPSWTVLLPPTPVALRASDIIQDDLNRTYVIGTAELTALGWRILAKQAAT